MGIPKHIVTQKDSIFLDSNVFIYALEDNTTLGENSRNLLLSIKEILPQTYTSALTIEEVLVGVYKEGLEEKIPLYLEFISGSGLITIIDFDKNIALLAARIRVEYGLRTPDSIQIATALSIPAKKFFSADKRFPKEIEGMEIRSISE